MRRTLRIYPVLLRAYWHLATAYRAVYVAWVVNTSFPLVMMAIWVGLAQGGPVQGYGAADFAAYYLAAVVVRRVTNCGIVADVEDLVRTGALSVYLVRPLDVVHHLAARVLASRLVGVPVAIAVLLTPGVRLDLRPPSLALFALACAAGLAFEFLAQYLIGGLSFWVTRAHGVGAAYQLAKSFLGGYVVPLAMFPPGLRGLLQLLPFQASMALPVEVLTGRAAPEAALARLGLCCAWTLALVVCARLLWRAGLRSYSAVGA